MTRSSARSHQVFARVLAGLWFIVPIAALGDSSTPAAGSPPPVTINSCGPIIDKSATTNVAGIPIPASTSSGIAIEFVNESSQPVTLVNFQVQSAGDQFVIRDVGTFSPGVSIKHKFRNGAGQAFVLPQFIAPKVHCSVASVKFADGSIWRKGQPAIATSASASATSVQQPSSLSASPSQLTIDSATNSELFIVESTARVTAFKETDNCSKVATIFVAATGDASATYSVRPVAAGSCTAQITDEAGHTISVPITVQ